MKDSANEAKEQFPPHFATYTDETNVFSISYPSDWEVLGFDIFAEGIAPVIRFAAEAPIGKGSHLPNVIVAAPPSFGIKKLDDIVEETIREWEDSPEDLTVFLRTRTTVDGREAVITEIEIHYPDTGRVRQLQMTMLKDKIVWTVACISKSEEFTKYRDDFYHIVRSLRILK